MGLSKGLGSNIIIGGEEFGSYSNLREEDLEDMDIDKSENIYGTNSIA